MYRFTYKYSIANSAHLEDDLCVEVYKLKNSDDIDVYASSFHNDAALIVMIAVVTDSRVAAKEEVLGIINLLDLNIKTMRLLSTNRRILKWLNIT